MIIKSKERIPAVYSESYDMSIFTGLLDLLYTGRQLNDLRAKVAHSPQHCFNEDLAHLASLLGFGQEATRDVLQHYRTLVKNKGTEPTIMAAISFAYNCVWEGKQQPQIASFDISGRPVIVSLDQPGLYLSTDGTVTTAYVDMKEERPTLFLTLLRRLAPVGHFIQVRPLAEKPV